MSIANTIFLFALHCCVHDNPLFRLFFEIASVYSIVNTINYLFTLCKKLSFFLFSSFFSFFSFFFLFSFFSQFLLNVIKILYWTHIVNLRLSASANRHIVQANVRWWCRASCPRMSVDILGTNCDLCRSMVQYCFTSAETVRLITTKSPGRPSRSSHSSWTLN